MSELLRKLRELLPDALAVQQTSPDDADAVRDGLAIGAAAEQLIGITRSIAEQARSANVAIPLFDSAAVEPVATGSEFFGEDAP